MSKRNILTSALISIALICNNAVAADCSDTEYAKNNPAECNFWAQNSTSLLAGTLVAGGAAALSVALLSMSGGDSDTSSTATTPVNPTLTVYNPIYNFVGDDVDTLSLAGIINNAEYVQNGTQYDDIRVGYSLARGYTGRGSTIAVLDSADWHGAAVEYFAAGTVAPNAKVDFYKIADKVDSFISYHEIGDAFASAYDANIINASWSIPMRATSVKSRAQMERVTDAHFISQISNAAARDTIIVFAAGNDGQSQPSALSALPLVMPELDGKFINVVAWDTTEQKLASYSNACGITQNYCITAPGSDLVPDTINAEISGTSFAAPIVSAAVAVIREAFPYMTASQVTSLLFETARDLGVAGVDAVYGHGMLDLERATRPVGAKQVPIAGTNAMQPLQTAQVSGAIAHNIESADLTMAYFDAYGRPFETKVSDNITIRNPGRGFARLRGDDAMGVGIGNFEFGFRTSDLVFGNGFLGNNTNTGEMVSFIGMKNEYDIGDVNFTLRTRLGLAMPDTDNNSMISSFSNLYTADVTLGAKYGDWTFTIGVPDTIISGDMNLRLPVGRAANGNIVYRDALIDMTSRPAMEYSVGYKFVNAGFIDNPYGNDEFYMMVRGNIQF